MTTHHENANPTNPAGRRFRRLLVPAVLGLVVLAGTACDVGDGSSAHPARADVDDSWKCVSAGDSARAIGSVTNHSSGESTYFLTVSFGDDAASATVEEVDAGETRVVEAVTHHVEGGVSACDITDVERFSA